MSIFCYFGEKIIEQMINRLIMKIIGTLFTEFKKSFVAGLVSTNILYFDGGNVTKMESHQTPTFVLDMNYLVMFF